MTNYGEGREGDRRGRRRRKSRPPPLRTAASAPLSASSSSRSCCCCCCGRTLLRFSDGERARWEGPERGKLDRSGKSRLEIRFDRLIDSGSRYAPTEDLILTIPSPTSLLLLDIMSSHGEGLVSSSPLSRAGCRVEGGRALIGRNREK